MKYECMKPENPLTGGFSGFLVVQLCFKPRFGIRACMSEHIHRASIYILDRVNNKG